MKFIVNKNSVGIEMRHKRQWQTANVKRLMVIYCFESLSRSHGRANFRQCVLRSERQCENRYSRNSYTAEAGLFKAAIIFRVNCVEVESCLPFVSGVLSVRHDSCLCTNKSIFDVVIRCIN